jgi:spore cortex formation protein SpoVR/YcgB (stage V sporulation)
MTTLEEREQISPGSYLEFLKSHSGVIRQAPMGAINVYALGYAMMSDLKRIITNPTEEDIKWFPDIAGKQDYMTIMKEIVQNFRDESFILQYLSPKVIRDMKFMSLLDEQDSYYTVEYVHSDEDVLAIRKALSAQYSFARHVPLVKIIGVDWGSSRELSVEIVIEKDRFIEETSGIKVIEYLQALWGFNCEITAITPDGELWTGDEEDE